MGSQFEKLAQIFELKRVGGAPKGHQFAPILILFTRFEDIQEISCFLFLLIYINVCMVAQTNSGWTVDIFLNMICDLVRRLLLVNMQFGKETLVKEVFLLHWQKLLS